MREPAPAGGLVRCGCREALVLPGRTCSRCREQDRPREKGQRKLHGLVMPAKPRPAEIATARRVQGDGHRWR